MKKLLETVRDEKRPMDERVFILLGTLAQTLTLFLGLGLCLLAFFFLFCLGFQLCVAGH